MDKNNETIKEELNKSITNLATLVTTPTTARPTATKVTPPGDDDTSTESYDTFDSWTIVNDKENNKEHIVEESENGVEILKTSDQKEDEHEKEVKKMEQGTQLNYDVTSDDFSDGISIISESESVGRISPHPYLRDHLHEFNMKFSLSDHMDDTFLNKIREDIDNEATSPQIQDPIAVQDLRQRHRSSTPVLSESMTLQSTSQSVAIDRALAPFVKRGFQSIFYLGVVLAILAIIGKIVHPTWQPLTGVGSSSQSTDELVQKVNDMELQNNLMRAEIDLLNKQVKYLSTLNDPQQHKHGKYKDFKDSKTFKAWPGNGDSLKPVEITKQDLRNPYKCPDGSFVEIANMCMEQSKVHEPSIVDQFGQVVKDLKEQSEVFKTIEKVVEEIQGYQDNPFEQLQEVFSEQMTTETPTKQFAKNKPIYETVEDIKQNQPYTKKNNKHPHEGGDPYSSQPHKYHKNDDTAKPNKDYKKPVGKNENKPDKEFKNYHGSDDYRDSSKERDEWKSDKLIDNSKERKYRKDNSKERYQKDIYDSKENQYKERYNRQKRKYDSENDDDNSGEWQEKYMRHRENQRKQNEQKYQDNKNWYIKRGDSREKRRVEKQYR